MNEQDIIRVLSENYSAGSEAFREELLERCLAVLSDQDGVRELADDELDMLAAAGDIASLHASRHERPLV